MNNEFNPFEFYGIDPNGKSVQEISRMKPQKNYYNPFLQNDSEGTTIDNTDGFSNFDGLAKSKDEEIMNRLNVNIQPKMNDEERWDYVNSLSEKDYRTFEELKRQGYNFEQRKTLMDNMDKLSNIRGEGEEKYYDDEGFLAGLRDLVQRGINAREGMGNLSEALDDYWYNWMEQQPNKDKLGAKIANTLETIPSWFLESLGWTAGETANWDRKIANTVIKGANLLGANIQPIEKGENYKSNLALGVEGVKTAMEGAGVYAAPVLYGIVGSIAQTDTRVGKGLQGVDGLLQYTASQIEKNDYLMNLAKEPGNEELVEDLEEIIKYVGYYVLTLGTKRATRAERIKIKNQWDKGVDKMMNGLREGTAEGLKSGKEATKVMEDIGETETKRIYDTQKGQWVEDNSTLTKGGKQTVREEAWKGFKEGFKRGWNTDKAIKPYTEPVQGGTYGAEGFALKGPETIPGEGKTTTQEGGWINDIINKGEKITTGLSNELLTKVRNSPVLQEGYNKIIKPFLEAGVKDLDKVIERPLSTLKAYLGNKIPEYRNAISKGIKTKGNQENISLLNKVEKMLDMDFMQTFEYFKKLNPSQKAIIEKIAPGFTKQLDFIGDIYDLTKSLGTNKDWLTKYLSYKSKSGRKWSIKGYAKRQMYKLLSKMWEGGKNRIKRFSLDEFIKSLDEKDVKKLSDLLMKEYNNENFTKADKAFLDSLKKNFEKQTYAKFKEGSKGDEGYMDLKKYESPKNINEVLKEKMPGQNKTIGEYFKDKGLELSIAKTQSTLNTITGDKGVLGFYDSLVDRIYTTETQIYKGVLFHEYFHRVFNQLTTTEQKEIINYIKEDTGLSEQAAVERFVEYGRNYLETGKINGKSMKNTLIQDLGEKNGKALANVMKNVKDEMFDLFNLDKGQKNIYEVLKDVKYDTNRGEEITKRKPINRTERDGIEEPGMKTEKDIKLQEEGRYGEGKYNKELGRNENPLDKLVWEEKKNNIKEFGFLKEPEVKYDNYLKEIRKEYPDIIGLTMRDGELYVKWLIESAWERWEQADRPGQREIKTLRAKDFFMPDELEKLPKDLQNLIKGGKVEMLKEPSFKKDVYLGERTDKDGYDSGILGEWAKEQTEKEIKSLSENIGKKEIIDWFEKYFDYELQRTDTKGDYFRDILGYLKGEKETKDFTETETFVMDFPNSVTKEINKKLGLNVVSIGNFHNKIKQLDERIHNPEKFKKNIKGKEYTVYYL